MELLYSRATPIPEFVSLSILLRSDISGADTTPISNHVGGGGEPLLMSGPLSSISKFSCLEAVTELHAYLNTILKASGSIGSSSKDTTTAYRFLKEDEKFLFGKNDVDFTTQIFRPKKCHGIAMQYHVIRDRKQLSSFLVPLILESSKLYSAKANNVAGFDMKEVTGVVFCVGIGGGPSAAFGVGTSSLTYSLGARMNNCINVVCSKALTMSTMSANRKRGGPAASGSTPTIVDTALARSLLTTLLLTDDEDRMLNSVVNGEKRTDIFQEDQFTRRMSTVSSKRRSSHHGMHGNGVHDESPLQSNSADQARIIVERMAVLSVSDSESMLRKYENRRAAKEAAAAVGKSSRKRMRKLARDADLDGFDFRGDKRSMSFSNLERNTTASGVGGIGGGDDISLSGRSTFTSASNLTLKGPKKDTASRTSNNRSRQPSLPGLLASSIKDSTSISKVGGRRNMAGRRANSVGYDLGASSGQSVGSFDPNASFASPHGSVASRNYQNRSRQSFDPFAATISESPPAEEIPTDATSNGGARILVHVALNEDLTCFYKVSKLSSCTVEGVIQVQVRSNADRGIPFLLSLRDPSSYIQSIQENTKYAESTADSTTDSDYAFTISVPKEEEYFPLMRYKCGNELRPVPIRVQTRVRLEEKHWRIALQISSNPHNEDSLTDLTIIMGVPPEVNGDSLSTSPPGGVWNVSKRSVIWCVSELGGGEKFQLQARFEKDPDGPDHFEEEEKPKFPVLVRCQCMYAQLSDIEVDVKALQGMNADVKMKLARRFRLSHRERS